MPGLVLDKPGHDAQLIPRDRDTLLRCKAAGLIAGGQVCTMAPTTSTAARPGEPAMEWIVAPSADERARGQLLPESLRAAHAAFRKHGCLLLPGVLSPPLIDAMHQDYVARYGVLDAGGMLEQSQRPVPNPIGPRGNARSESTLRISGPFAKPAVLCDPLPRWAPPPL